MMFFVLLTRITLEGCGFSSLHFSCDSQVSVLFSLPGCIALVPRSLPVGWNLRLFVSETPAWSISLLGWTWDQMCYNNHLELEANNCLSLFSWLYRWAVRLWSEALFSQKEIWKKLDLLINGTGWWHWIVASCNIGFVEVMGWKHS